MRWHAAGRGRRSRLNAVWLLPALCAAIDPASAQEVAAARGATTIAPTLSVTETLVDNSRDGTESVTTITPGLRVTSRSGRVQGSLDYGLSAVIEVQSGVSSSLQNRLSAQVRAEAIPNHLDVNATGSISRQAISSRGLQSFTNALTDENQTEVRTFSISPVLRGVLGGVVGVQAAATASRTDSSETAGSTSANASLDLSSVRPGKLGWSLNATREVSDFDAGRKTTTDRAIASVFYSPDIDWRFALRGGQERTDLLATQLQTYDNWGAGVLWTPGPRTSVSLDGDRRAFGKSHAVAVQHRLRRAVFRFSDSQEVTSDSGQTGAGGLSAYDLFFELFASQEPDPVLRDALVRDFLRRNGIDPNALLGGGFVSAAPTIQRRQELSVALQGQRTSYVLRGFATRSRRADPLSTGLDDLALGPLNQRGLSLSVSHTLTARDSLSLTASTLRSLSDGASLRSTLTSLDLTWSTRLSERASFSLSGRLAESSDDTAPYTETAVTAAFATRF